MATVKKKTMFVGVLIVAGILFVIKYFTQSTQESSFTVSQPDKTLNNAVGSPSPQKSPQPSGTASQPSTVVNQPTAATKQAHVTTTYFTPGGESQVGFTISTDTNGIITDITTTVLGPSRTQAAYQQSFAEAAPAVLKGKKLSTLATLDRVGGSSLTTEAFNNSIDKLKASL